MKLHQNRAYCYAKVGCYSEAVLDYDDILQVDPANMHAMHNRWVLDNVACWRCIPRGCWV